MNKIIHGDCLVELKTLEENSIDSIVTDPPYELGFMGKSWDNTGIANNPLMWAECLRVLKPGGHMLAFSGTRTYHRMAVAIEDAGFEVRDMIEWVYSTGFPKSLNVYKQLQKNCKCGNMEEYDNERTQQNTKYNMRPMSEKDLSQEINSTKEQWEVLQSQLSEQSLEIQQSKSTKNVWEGKSSLEGGSNVKENSWELSGNNLSEMSEGVSTNGEERRIHNATQISDGSTLEQTINKNRSSASYRPQSEKQQDREPCAFCQQWGTQKIRRTAEETFGVGTALKPAHEPICMARKPLAEKTVAENCLKWGTGGIDIDESRVEYQSEKDKKEGQSARPSKTSNANEYALNHGGLEGMDRSDRSDITGRFPANLIHNNSEEVRECFPEAKTGSVKPWHKKSNVYGGNSYFESKTINHATSEGDSGNASRFFKSIPIHQGCYSAGLPCFECKDNYLELKQEEYKSLIYQAKASKSERNKGCEGLEEKESTKFDGGDFQRGGGNNAKEQTHKNNHPTVKPIALMEYLIKMVTPKGGIVLDPFAGSGSTLVAAKQNGYQYVGIEMTEEYIPIIEARLNE